MSAKNKKVIEFRLRSAEAYYTRGKTFADLGNAEQAIEDYTQSVELHPTDAETYD